MQTISGKIIRPGTLPIASPTDLGVVKVGSGLAVAGDGTLSVTGSGSGGGNVSSGLYDISMGVPLLAGFTQVDPTSIMTYSEHANKALVMKVTGTTPGVPNVQGLARTAPTAPYSVAALMLFNGVPHEFWGVAFGFRESSTGKLDVMICSALGAYGPAQYLHQTYSDPMTRVNNVQINPVGVNDDGKPQWYHITDDGTNVSLGISSDGATPYEILTFAKSGGYLTAYDEVLIGVLPEGSAGISATGMSVTCLCYDEHGATRLPGPAGSGAATTSMPGQATFYDPGDVTGWTWVNQTDYSTTADTTYYNSALNLHVPAPTTMGQDNRRMLMQSLPAAPWTMTAAFNGQIFPTNYYNFGIAIYNSSSGKHIGFTPLVEQSGNPSIALVKYNSVHQGGTADGAYISFLAAYNMWTSGVMWYRVTDDGTTRNFYFSNNGVVWMLVYSAASLDYGMMDSAGFYVNPVNSSSQYDTNMTLLSWHIDNSILGPTTPA